MKKYVIFLLGIVCALMFVTVPLQVSAEEAEDEYYGKINLSVKMLKSVVGNVYVTLTNTTTQDDITIMLPSENGNKWSFTAKFGHYTLKSSEVKTIDGYPLTNFVVIMDDFTLDESNPNGNWQWNVEGELRAVFPDEEPTKPVESPHGEEENHDIFTFKIESDNPYFPDMTIPQIQEWYTKEVTAFIESGQTDKKLEEFQEDVTAWSGYVTRNNASGLSIVYRADVEKYGKQDETRDFYEVQKKMYDFLRDYYEKNGKALNFNRWIYDDMPEPTKEVTPELSATPEPTKEATPVLSATPEPTKEATPVLSATPEPEPKKENRFIALLKRAWFTLLILGIILVGGIIWKSKYKNTDN